MTCPYCRRDMEHGLLQSQRVIFFTKKKKAWFFTPAGDDVKVSKNNWTAPNAEAHLCRSCGKIIVDCDTDG